jgi:hypothetical protein
LTLPVTFCKQRVHNAGHTGLLVPDDIIDSVNGTQCVGMTHREAVDMVKELPEQVTLTIVRARDVTELAPVAGNAIPPPRIPRYAWPSRRKRTGSSHWYVVGASYLVSGSTQRRDKNATSLVVHFWRSERH